MKILKCCGIREGIQNYNGIDMLGFNFITSSKRYITPKKASKIKTPSSCLRVWVFWEKDAKGGWKIISDQALEKIIIVAEEAYIHALQIYWECDFTYLKEYNFCIIHWVSLSDYINKQKGKKKENIDFLIIDWENPWSWEKYVYQKINELDIDMKFLVAGWISQDNILEVFEIFKNNKNFCWVDIASWVDNWKNIDSKKVQDIVEKIKWVDII